MSSSPYLRNTAPATTVPAQTATAPARTPATAPARTPAQTAAQPKDTETNASPATEKDTWVDNPLEVGSHLAKYSGIILGIIIFLFLAGGVLLYFCWKFSDKLYKTVSTGQDGLCNLYTCSGDNGCGNYPKIHFPDGSFKCLTT